MNLVQKISTGVITGALLTSVMAASAFAGTRDNNRCDKNGGSTLITSSACKVIQKNTSTIITDVDSAALTGGIIANFNTGKRSLVSVTSGDAASKVTVKVGGSVNIADNPCCGCKTDTVSAPSLIEDGQQGGNVTIISSNSSVVKQTNDSTIVTDVDSIAATGGVSASFNTGGGIIVDTGDAKSTVKVVVTGSENVLN